MEVSEKLLDQVSPILEQQDKLQRIMDSVSTPKISMAVPSLDKIKQITDNGSLDVLKGNMRDIDGNTSILNIENSLRNNCFIHTLGELAIKSAIPDYQFETPMLKAFETWTENAITNIATGLTALIANPIMQKIPIVSSNLCKWLLTVDFSPITNILENIEKFGFDYDREKIDEVFLKAMFDARWFPYAGLIGDFRILSEILDILETSRATKNRVKRIDKVFFYYYDKEEIDNLKRSWRHMNLPSYMIRILVQCIQAYHRREYALTVSTLSTLWEGIIQEKVNDNGFRISRRTRENLAKLIIKNLDFYTI